MTLSIRLPQLLITMLIISSIAHSQVDSLFSFYPLDKGNSWQYRSTYVTRIMGSEVGRSVYYYTVNIYNDTTVNSGRRYYVVQSSDKSLSQPRYQRIDSLTSQVFVFDTSSNGKELRLDSLPPLPGSPWSGRRLLPYPGRIAQKIDTQFFFGTPRVCRHYFSPVGIGPYAHYTLTEGIGVSTFVHGVYDVEQYQGSSIEDTLVYAKINGKEYGTLVSVRQNRKEVDANFTLDQNYSNPFNPTTIIRYALPEGDHVSMKVYDALGRHIATLADEWQTAGLHTAIFSATNLSSGAYFLNFRAGRFNTTKKILFLK